MNIVFNDEEEKVLEALAKQADMSQTQVLRQALRMYQIIQVRVNAGETLTFSGDKERIALFVGPGFNT